METSFDYTISLLLSPVGVFACITALALAVTALTSQRCQWLLLCLVLWASALGVGSFEPDGRYLGPSLWMPLQKIAEQGRLIAVALLIALIVPSVLRDRGWRVRIVSGAAIGFLIFQCVFAGRILLTGQSERGVGSVLVYLLIFAVVSYGVAQRLQEPRDVLIMLWMIAMAGFLFAVTNTFQLLISPGSASVNGRFSGTAGNAQHAATCIGCVLPPIFVLITRKQTAKVWRLFLAATAGLLVVLLTMTGSRTGALMVVVGTTIAFRKSLGRFVRLAVVLCILTFLAAMLFPEKSIDADRFTSLEDTRSQVWHEMMAQFEQSPIVGVMNEQVGIRENSYLSTAARAGIVGLLPMAIAIFLSGKAVVRLYRVRPMLGEYDMLADVAAAGLISIAVGAITEGYLLAVLSIHILLVYVYLAIISFLLDYADAIRASAAVSEEIPADNEELVAYEEIYGT